ncbi:hypothetical protein UPYG_G00087600, partial [Umbra pygmaea]
MRQRRSSGGSEEEVWNRRCLEVWLGTRRFRGLDDTEPLYGEHLRQCLQDAQQHGMCLTPFREMGAATLSSSLSQWNRPPTSTPNSQVGASPSQVQGCGPIQWAPRLSDSSFPSLPTHYASPASSPSKTASSPSTAASSPSKTASSPSKTASSPSKTASSPSKTASSPSKTASSPSKTASSPSTKASFPGTTASSPGKTASSPGKTASSPGKTASSPSMTASSPSKIASSPSTTASSPNTTASSHRASVRAQVSAPVRAQVTAPVTAPVIAPVLAPGLAPRALVIIGRSPFSAHVRDPMPRVGSLRALLKVPRASCLKVEDSLPMKILGGSYRGWRGGSTPPADCPQPPAVCPQPPADCPQPPAVCPQPPADCPQQPAVCPQPPADCPQQPAVCPQPPADCPQQLAVCPQLPERDRVALSISRLEGGALTFALALWEADHPLLEDHQ